MWGNPIVVFGTRYGDAYEGSPKYVFEWFADNDIDIQPVWTTQNDAVYQRLSKEGQPVVHQNSTKGMYTVANATAAVLTHNKRDITIPWISSPWTAVPETTTIIKGGHDYPISWTSEEDHRNSEEQRRKARQEYESVDYFIETSDFRIRLWQRKNRALDKRDFDRSKHVITGFPRNDILYGSPDVPSFLKTIDIEMNDKKIILYAPTKRNPNRWDQPITLFPFQDYTADKLNEFLSNNDMVLLLRLHPRDTYHLENNTDERWAEELRSQLEKLESQSHVIMADHETIPDVYPLLHHTDYMITDYSSIFFDFLLLNRPMLFFADDFEEFIQRKGEITFDYFDTIPGPHVESFEAFRTYLESVQRGNDAHAADRSELLEKMHHFRDGNATERVAKIVEDVAEHGRVTERPSENAT